MSNLPQIPGAKKPGVVLLSSEEDFKKLDAYLINDTVCIDGPAKTVFNLAKSIQAKHKVAIKVVSTEKFPAELPADIEVMDSPIQEIVGEGRAEAVKFKDGKAVGVCLVLFVDKTIPDKGEEMAELLIQLGTKGADAVLNLTRESVEKAISEKSKDAKIGFPETNYYLPLSHALLNIEVKNLGDCLLALRQAEGLNRGITTQSGLNIPALGGILNKGVATLLAEEILAALKVAGNEHPAAGIGFIPDKILRSLGLQLVDGRICGIAVILGAAKDAESAVELIRNFQSKSIVSLLAGNIQGKTFAAQIAEKGVEVGLENYIVPLGEDYLSAIYAVNFAVRAPLIYGGFKPGQWQEVAVYLRNRVPAFVLLLGHVDEVLVATGLGALACGFPIITDLDVPQLGKIDTTLYEALVTQKDYKKIASQCILSRGIKVKLAEVAIPLPYAAAFEGERVRKEQLHAEFGGKAGISFEYLASRGVEEVEDGKIELIGPDIDTLTAEKKSLPLAIMVEVYGRKMQKDFEPILERQIHRFMNYAQGIMHVGQRDMNWIRISQEAFNKGFRVKHIGVILHAMLHQEYSAIVDKVQVKLYTKEADVEKLLPKAKKAYAERDERIGGMTDESVDTYYSCLLCVPKGEEIVLADGSFKRVEDVINDSIETENYRVLSFDTYDFQSQSIGELFINPAPKFLTKISLRSGNSIMLTSNHKVLIDTKDGLIWQGVARLNKNDTLLSIRNTNIENKTKDFYIIDFLPETLKVYDDDFVDYLKEKIIVKYKKLGIFAKEINISYGRFYQVFYRSDRVRHRHRLTLSEVKTIVFKLGMDWEEVKLKIHVFGTTCSKGYQLFKEKLNEDIMYLAGLVASDGCVMKRKNGLHVQFTNSEDALIDKFDSIIGSLFGMRTRRYYVLPKIHRSKKLKIISRKKVTVLHVNNSIFGWILKGMKIGRQDGEKWAGEIISQLSNKLVACFLRGLFDGDGHVTKTHLMISMGSYRQAQHTLLLLKKLGIGSYISKMTRGFQVGTRSFGDYKKFKELISSWHPAKKSKMDVAKFLSDKNHVVRTDTIPLKCSKLINSIFIRYKNRIEFTKLPIDYKSIEYWRKAKRRASKEKLKLFLDYIKDYIGSQDSDYQELLLWSKSNIIFEKVKSVEKLKYGEKEVYNFSVANTHNYLVNGIVAKNCQSFAPNHVCIITPERLGLCGAYSWLDAKASFEITPTGPNQPIIKGALSDKRLGQWENVNAFVQQKSNQTIEKVSMYSLMDSPQSSCGCFECIIAIIPEANGVMIVHRDYAGMTPCGMTFTTLAGSVGGGVQTPGFLGVGKLYMLSKKFISAEGGLKRVVWMPKELKELLGDKLIKRAQEVGEPELINKIADETQATTSEELLAFLQKVRHPALEMEPLV